MADDGEEGPWKRKHCTTDENFVEYFKAKLSLYCYHFLSLSYPKDISP